MEFKNFYNYVIYCSYCSNKKEYEHRYPSFEEELKEDGWKIISQNVACPYCVSKIYYHDTIWVAATDGKEWFPHATLIKEKRFNRKENGNVEIIIEGEIPKEYNTDGKVYSTHHEALMACDKMK